MTLYEIGLLLALLTVISLVDARSLGSPNLNFYGKKNQLSYLKFTMPSIGKLKKWKNRNSWYGRQQAESSRLFGTMIMIKFECAKKTGSGFMGL